MGAKKRPFYRLVVADSRSPRDGRFIELLGYYDPLTNPARVQVDADKVHEWMRKGARPSDAARALLVQQGILARVPRVFKPAPEPEPTAAASAVATEVPAGDAEAEVADAPADAAAQAEPAGDAGSAADPPVQAAAGDEPAASGSAAAEAES
jgi:small subunit ribosomal protein S16